MLSSKEVDCNSRYILENQLIIKNLHLYFCFLFQRLVQKQKVSLIESSRTYYYLRYYLKQVSDICEGKEFLYITVFNNIRELLNNVTIVMNQYRIILNTCPEESLGNDKFEYWEIPTLDSQIPDNLCLKASPLWLKAVNFINRILNLTCKLNSYLLKCRGETPSFEYDLATPDFIPINEILVVRSDLDEISTNISEMENIFGNIPLAESLSWLKTEIKKISTCNPIQTDATEKKFRRKTEKLVEEILFITQNLYKKYSKTNLTEELKTQAENEEVVNQIREEHLTRDIIDNLSSDLMLLEMPKVLTKVHRLSKLLKSSSANAIKTLKPLVYQVLPLLEQFIQLQQFFLTQQVSAYRVTCKMTSIVLNIFIELSSKVTV